MAIRDFTDDRGRRWSVWDVHPTSAERRLRDAGPPPGVSERRHYDDRRLRLRSSMAQAWLAFESKDGERRRLRPIPKMSPGLAEASEHQLREWCAIAEPAPAPRRLIE
jgi:hypothetical protein